MANETNTNQAPKLGLGASLFTALGGGLAGIGRGSLGASAEAGSKKAQQSLNRNQQQFDRGQAQLRQEKVDNIAEGRNKAYMAQAQVRQGELDLKKRQFYNDKFQQYLGQSEVAYNNASLDRQKVRNAKSTQTGLGRPLDERQTSLTNSYANGAKNISQLKSYMKSYEVTQLSPDQGMRDAAADHMKILSMDLGISMKKGKTGEFFSSPSMGLVRADYDGANKMLQEAEAKQLQIEEFYTTLKMDDKNAMAGAGLHMSNLMKAGNINFGNDIKQADFVKNTMQEIGANPQLKRASEIIAPMYKYLKNDGKIDAENMQYYQGLFDSMSIDTKLTDEGLLVSDPDAQDAVRRVSDPNYAVAQRSAVDERFSPLNAKWIQDFASKNNLTQFYQGKMNEAQAMNNVRQTVEDQEFNQGLRQERVKAVSEAQTEDSVGQIKEARLDQRIQSYDYPKDVEPTRVAQAFGLDSAQQANAELATLSRMRNRMPKGTVDKWKKEYIEKYGMPDNVETKTDDKGKKTVTTSPPDLLRDAVKSFYGVPSTNYPFAAQFLKDKFAEADVQKVLSKGAVRRGIIEEMERLHKKSGGKTPDMDLMGGMTGRENFTRGNRAGKPRNPSASSFVQDKLQ